MGTRLWGPDTWYVIHVIADSAPDKLSETDKQAYQTFFMSLADVLPCPTCSIHFKQFLKEEPPVFNTRADMLLWTIRAHNHANRQTGAKELTEQEGLASIERQIKQREHRSGGNIEHSLLSMSHLTTIGITVIFTLLIVYTVTKLRKT